MEERADRPKGLGVQCNKKYEPKQQQKVDQRPNFLALKKQAKKKKKKNFIRSFY
jgi:hypothetical protein